jgi:hypothetical protein
MKLFAQLLGIVSPVGTAPAGDDDAGRRHAGETGESDELPGHAHPVELVGYGL